MASHDDNVPLFFTRPPRQNSRIPPGGKSSDIFNQEKDEDVFKIHMDDTASAYGSSPPPRDAEYASPRTVLAAGLPSHHRSLSDRDLRAKEARRTPPLAAGKENVDVYKGLLDPKKILRGVDAVRGEKGEGVGSLMASGGGFESPDQGAVGRREPKKPSVRVKQPPGGKSSIVF